MATTEYEEFTPEQQPPFWKFDREGEWHTIIFLKRLTDSDQFEVGPKGKKKPAPVWLVKDEFDDEYRLTLTSSYLTKCIEYAQSKLGDAWIGTPLQFKPEGKDKERTYKVRWAKAEQQKLGA